LLNVFDSAGRHNYCAACFGLHHLFVGKQFVHSTRKQAAAILCLPADQKHLAMETELQKNDPMISANVDSTNASPTNCFETALPLAPRARRKPISLLRKLMLYQSTPNIQEQH